MIRHLKEYSRSFESEQRKRDVSTHGSPEMETYWGRNTAEEAITRTIIEQFSLSQPNKYAHFGSDGRFNYQFLIQIPSPLENKKTRYSISYNITLSGSKEDLESGKCCDLEEELKKNRFSQQTY